MLTILIFFVFGLIIGSFLNVVVYRLNMLESVMGRSRCPRCKAKIRWYDNVPVLSFLLLGAKCRDCGEKISWQYPLVEIFTGFLFALVGGLVFSAGDPASWLEALYYLGVFAIFVVILTYDFKFMEIPMLVLWSGVVWSLVMLLVVDWSVYAREIDFFQLRIVSGLIAGIGSFLFFFAISYGSKEKWMGMGDAYVALLAGLTVGWPGIFLALVGAFGIGSFYGIVLVLLKNKTMKSQVPFAPFIAFGVFLTFFACRLFPELSRYFLLLE